VDTVRSCSLLLLSATLAFPQASLETLIEKGHHKRARTLAEQRYRENPKDPAALWAMSEVKQAFGDANAAIDLAEKAVAADPKNPRYHMRLADAVGEEAGKAGKLRQIGLGRRFKKELDTVLALDPRNPHALLLLMEFQLEAPGIFGGDKSKAHEVPSRIMSIDPALGYLAEVRLKRFDKQTDGVEALLRKAVEAKPGSYDAHLSLGQFCLGNKKFEEAEQHAREGIRLDPERVASRRLLSASFVQQKKWSELDRILAESEKAIPDNLAPFFVAAVNCVLLNMELPRAAQYLRKYLAQEPEAESPTHADAHFWLGRALEKQAQKAEAIAEYQAALKLNPQSPAKADLKRLQ
jgi:tetratricopeptide (TPR) repeat protein